MSSTPKRPPAKPYTLDGLPPGLIFVSDIPFGFTMPDKVTMLGDAVLDQNLCSSNSALPRPSVLATIADCVAGVPACEGMAPRLAVTLDIVVNIVAQPTNELLIIEGSIIKKGRNVVASEVDFFDSQTKALVARSYLTFMASPRPQDVAPPVASSMRTTSSMPTPFPEHVGAHIVRPGVAQIEHSSFVQQAAGTLQGGIISLLGEMATESLAGAPVVDLDIRYLSAVRVGPGQAIATPLGPDLYRVEVRDLGSENRLAAVITARVARSPLENAE